MLGVGYRFGDWAPGASSPAQSRPSYASYRRQLQPFGGQTTLNSLALESSPTYGLDYQIAVSKLLAASATWFHATHWVHNPPNRVAAQLRIEHRLDDTPLAFGAGVGVYAALGGPSGPPSITPQPIAGLLVVRASWQLSQHASVVANWFRTFTQDDRDLDIIVLGLAWGLGSR